jgi:hypothetical protein
MTKTITIPIDGKPWTIRMVPRAKVLDRADGSANHRRRVIRIANDLTPDAQVETLLHEIAHARLWDLDEEAIHDLTRAQSSALWPILNADLA